MVRFTISLPGIQLPLVIPVFCPFYNFLDQLLLWFELRNKLPNLFIVPSSGGPATSLSKYSDRSEIVGKLGYYDSQHNFVFEVCVSKVIVILR